MRLTLNVLLTLLLRAKITGKGRMGNGRIFIRLLSILADGDSPGETREWNTLHIFTDLTYKAQAYRRIGRLLFDFLPTGKGYPASKIKMQHFEAQTGLHGRTNWGGYRTYLAEMGDFCKDMLDPAKMPPVIHTLLTMLRQDNSITSLYYGGRFLPKAALIGTAANPRCICVESFLLGLLYQTMKDFACEDAAEVQLLSPDRPTFVLQWIGGADSQIFWGDPDALQTLLDPGQAVPVTSRLALHSACSKPQSIGHYPLQMAADGKVQAADTLPALPMERILLRGACGIGKTVLLSDLQGESRFLLHLSHYRKMRRDTLSPEHSCWILVQILLRYCYGGAYPTLDGCIACEGEMSVFRALSALQDLLQGCGTSPAYTVFLDGVDALPPGSFPEFAAELRTLLRSWRNVRWIVSSRAVPGDMLFDDFTVVDLLGLSDETRDSLLLQAECHPKDAQLLELLRSPLFLQRYLASQSTREAITTRGEILDAYFRNLYDTDSLLSFLVRFALPIAANLLLAHPEQALTRADLTDAADAACALYLDTERIYQNAVIPQHFRRDTIRSALAGTDAAALLTEGCGFLERAEDGRFRFTHQYYRDYFAACHYVRLMEVITQCFDYRQISDVQAIFDKWRLGHIWFAGEDADVIYSLIGELCGDDRNVPDSEDFACRRTVLDDMLDFARELDHFRLTENIIRIMHLSRNGVVCGVDFSGLNLPFTMPEETYFSRNGDDPCDFRDTNVLGVFASSPPEHCEQYYLGCDFTGASFFPIRENREILLRYGAVMYDPDEE